MNYSFRFDDDSEWRKLDIVAEKGTTVWYREVEASETDQSWYLLDGKTGDEYENGFVEVNATAVTKATVDTAAQAELVFTAYAAQKDNRTVEEAWALFNQN